MNCFEWLSEKTLIQGLECTLLNSLPQQFMRITFWHCVFDYLHGVYRFVQISFSRPFMAAFLRASHFEEACFSTRCIFSINDLILYEKLLINEVVANPLLMRGSFFRRTAKIEGPAFQWRKELCRFSRQWN